MSFPNLDLVELADKTLTKINKLGKVKLNNFDLAFKFSKDSNPLAPQINIYLYVFDEEFSQSVYSKKCNTVEKIIELFVSQLKDEYMYPSVRDGLILTKIRNLKHNLFDTLSAIKSKLIDLNEGSDLGVVVDIDELRNGVKKENNGMPKFVLEAKCLTKKVQTRIPIAPNASDWDGEALLEAFEAQLPK